MLPLVPRPSSLGGSRVIPPSAGTRTAEGIKSPCRHIRLPSKLAEEEGGEYGHFLLLFEPFFE